MKKFCSRGLIILFVFAFSNICQAQETVRLASGEWPPYQSKNLKHAGFVSRIVTEAFAHSGIKVEYGYFAWKQSFEFAKTGKWDGTMIWFDTPERREIFYISDPVIDVSYVLFHKKDLIFDWNKMADLRPFKVGATEGYDYGNAFQNAEKDGSIHVVRKPSDGENFQRLDKDEIHLFPCDIEVGYELIGKQFGLNQISAFSYHPKPVRSAPHFLLLSKKNPKNKALMALFNEGLRQLKANGKFDQYIAESRRGEYHR